MKNSRILLLLAVITLCLVSFVSAVPPAPIACYSFDTDATDTMGLQDGTFQGNAGIDTGDKMVGAASLELNASGDYVDLTNTAEFAFNWTDTVTICGWGKTTSSSWRAFYARDEVGSPYAEFSVKQNSQNRMIMVFTDQESDACSFAGPTGTNNGQWHFICGVHDGGNGGVSPPRVYLDGSAAAEAASSADCGDSTAVVSNSAKIGRSEQGMNWIGNIDELMMFDYNLTAAQIAELNGTEGGSPLSCSDLAGGGDVTPPGITQYNCTSCSPPAGDNETPFTTADTTPTFVIDTNESAYCAISRGDENYTTMISGNSDRDCTGGPSQQLTWVLQPSDALLVNQTDYVFIACQDTSGNENGSSTSGGLEMQITLSRTEILGDDAIERAINSSVPGASKYSSQRVYARNLNNAQSTGRFDWFVAQTSPQKRWAINYVTTDDPTSNFTYMFNITPVFYVLELEYMTEAEINSTVYDMIMGTKS